MKLTVLTFALNISLGATMAQTSELRPVAAGRADQTISAYTPVGRMVLPAREVLVEGKYPDGKPLLGNLLIFFDPSTGRFLWDCSTYHAPLEYRGVPGRLPEHRPLMTDMTRRNGLVVYADSTRLTAFGALPHDISTRESRQKAESLNEAENKALRDASDQLSAAEHNGAYGWKSISLQEHLSRGFFAPKGSAAPGGFVFSDVARDDDRWEIMLQGQWRVKVVLYR